MDWIGASDCGSYSSLQLKPGWSVFTGLKYRHALLVLHTGSLLCRSVTLVEMGGVCASASVDFSSIDTFASTPTPLHNQDWRWQLSIELIATSQSQSANHAKTMLVLVHFASIG